MSTDQKISIPSIQNNSDKNHKIFFFSLLFLTIWATFNLVAPFIAIITVTILFSAMIHPFYAYLKTKINKGIALGITFLSALFILIMPVIILTFLLIKDGTSFILQWDISNYNNVLAIEKTLSPLLEYARGIPVLADEVTGVKLRQNIQNILSPISSFFIGTALNIGNSSLQFIASFFLFLFFTILLTPNVRKLRDYMIRLSPLDDRIDEIYFNRVSIMIKNVLQVNLLIAVVQGILGGLMLWIVGTPYIFTLSVLLMFLSLVPVIGTPILTLPIAIYHFLIGDWIGGIFIILFQTFVISTVDNIFRAVLIPTETALHPMLLLLGFFGGVQMFGALGIIFGPVIMILFITSLEIYLEYYKGQ